MINVYIDDIRILPDYYKNSDELWVPIRKVEDVIGLLQKGVVYDLSLDHDMGTDEPTGYDLMCWMERNNVWPKGNVYVHSANPVGAQKMQVVIDKWRKNR